MLEQKATQILFIFVPAHEENRKYWLVGLVGKNILPFVDGKPKPFMNEVICNSVWWEEVSLKVVLRETLGFWWMLITTWEKGSFQSCFTALFYPQDLAFQNVSIRLSSGEGFSQRKMPWQPCLCSFSEMLFGLTLWVDL